MFLLYFSSKLQNGGPALATALAGYFNFFMLFAVFRLRHGRMGTMEILVSLFKIAVCSGLMGGLCWVMLRFSGFFSYPHFWQQLAVFTGMIVAATLVYLGLSWLLRCPEIEEVYGIAIRREGAQAGPPTMMG